MLSFIIINELCGCAATTIKKDSSWLPSSLAKGSSRPPVYTSYGQLWLPSVPTLNRWQPSEGGKMPSIWLGTCTVQAKILSATLPSHHAQTFKHWQRPFLLEPFFFVVGLEASFSGTTGSANFAELLTLVGDARCELALWTILGPCCASAS